MFMVIWSQRCLRILLICVCQWDNTYKFVKGKFPALRSTVLPQEQEVEFSQELLRMKSISGDTYNLLQKLGGWNYYYCISEAVSTWNWRNDGTAFRPDHELSHFFNSKLHNIFHKFIPTVANFAYYSHLQFFLI